MAAADATKFDRDLTIKDDQEYHHFEYEQFRRPGDVHVQFFGTSVASFADGVLAVEGDVFEFGISPFDKPLVNAQSRAKLRTADRVVSQLTAIDGRGR